MQRRPIDPHAPAFGVYRARVTDGETGDTRKARALVFAALPDRLHVEVVSSIGTTQMILDAGVGRVAVTLPRERLSYVGPADDRALEALVGVRASPDWLVRALLLGEAEGRDLEREGPTGVVPERLRLRTENGALELWRRAIEPVRADVARLGTGEAPEGMEQRPLDELLENPSRARSGRP